MPVIAAAPSAVEAAPAPWPAAPEDEAVLEMPALQELLPLQPAKLAVYKLFTEQVRALHTIPYAFMYFWLQCYSPATVQSCIMCQVLYHSRPFLLAGVSCNYANGCLWE